MRLIFALVLQWIATSFGLWIAASLLGTASDTYNQNMGMSVFLLAGLVLSIINIFIRPIVSLISLPITIMTLGLFILVINGLMVYLALRWTDGIDMSFINSIIAGVIIGIVNFVIGNIVGVLNANEKGENNE